MSDQLHNPAPLPPEPWYLLSNKLCGPQRRSEYFWEEKNCWLYCDLDPGPPRQSNNNVTLTTHTNSQGDKIS